MISLSLLSNPEDQHRKKLSDAEQGSKILYLPGDLSVRIEYPHELRPDILSAVEIIVIIVVPAFAQNAVLVDLVRIRLSKSDVRISLYKKMGELIKEYEYPIQQLLDLVKEARSRLLSTEGKTVLIAKMLEDLDA